jgi:hypothetical protein
MLFVLPSYTNLLNECGCLVVETMLRIRNVPNSNVGCEIRSLNCLCGSSQSLQETAKIVGLLTVNHDNYGNLIQFWSLYPRSWDSVKYVGNKPIKLVATETVTITDIARTHTYKYIHTYTHTHVSLNFVEVYLIESWFYKDVLHGRCIWHKLKNGKKNMMKT